LTVLLELLTALLEYLDLFLQALSSKSGGPWPPRLHRLCDEISNLDVTGNGISMIESFTNRKFVDNPKHNPSLLVPFEFLPGHQERKML